MKVSKNEAAKLLVAVLSGAFGLYDQKIKLAEGLDTKCSDCRQIWSACFTCNKIRREDWNLPSDRERRVSFKGLCGWLRMRMSALDCGDYFRGPETDSEITKLLSEKGWMHYGCWQ